MSSPIMSPLEDLRFQDIYMKFPPGNPFEVGPPVIRYKPKPKLGEPDVAGVFPIPDQYIAAMETLTGQVLQAYRGRNKKNFAFQATPNLRIRTVTYFDEQGRWRTALRSLDRNVHKLNELNISPEVLILLRRWMNRKGGVFVFGATGHGKSTTCTSMIDDFLSDHGGYMYSAEDPMEFEFDADNYKSAEVCQREIDDDDGWEPAMKDALRSRPDVVYASEFRNAPCVKMLLRASTSGHLTISTGHASSVDDGLMFMGQSASELIGNMAWVQLSQGLVGAIHQTLINGRPHIVCLENTEAVASIIRENKFHLLSSEIEQQQNQLEIMARDGGRSTSSYAERNTTVSIPRDMQKPARKQNSSDTKKIPAKAKTVKRRPKPPPTTWEKLRGLLPF
ncbi:ATPase, T2SS/T4P/T4SS family [Acetobacter pasteurianus]|uniref:Twitching motility protein n=1 Tax=Acetobacter pasteurianus NBRC 3188 TaxID=1226663 RepID=A0A401WXG3_ACEPA|nr:ATPase, T2SS/T4P/T4SS family [Acetobacter pasteurianus]GCD53983.1 twitching motility protein [Acetobacter pasteurianus NBRC 3188]